MKETEGGVETGDTLFFCAKPIKMIENINWYPGHMKKTRELIQNNLKMVDAVVEVIDARIPVSSRNPIIDELVSAKPRIIAINKSDLADAEASRLWKAKLTGRPAANGQRDLRATSAVIMNSMTGEGTKQLYSILEKIAAARTGAGAMKPCRLMIVGVPNCGKSSLINRMTGRKSTKTGDRPGVTKGKQWLTLENGMQLLDTPGILWPKFEDPNVGLNLAFCGSIKDEILDVPTLAMELVKVLTDKYPELLRGRYKLEELLGEGDESPETGYPIETETDAAVANLHQIALKRGCILPGRRIDYERAGKLLLDEFRAAKIGRITLEWPGME